jgi:hypothetical protein
MRRHTKLNLPNAPGATPENTHRCEATRGPGPGGPRVKPWRLGTAVGRGRTKAQLRVLSILALAARAEGRARQAPPVLRCLSARAAPASRPRFMGEFTDSDDCARGSCARGAFLVVCGRMASKRARKCCPRPAPPRPVSVLLRRRAAVRQ